MSAFNSLLSGYLTYVPDILLASKVTKSTRLAKASNVKVINNETNETIVYSSNYKAAEALDCSETTIRNYLKNKKLYKGKYLFLKD